MSSLCISLDIFMKSASIAIVSFLGHSMLLLSIYSNNNCLMDLKSHSLVLDLRL